MPVLLTVLGSSEVRMPGTVLDFSGRGLRLTVDQPLPLGTAVKVETNDALLLGDICYCGPEGSGYSLGLELHQALMGLHDLASLNSRLLADGRDRRAFTPSVENETATNRR